MVKFHFWISLTIFYLVLFQISVFYSVLLFVFRAFWLFFLLIISCSGFWYLLFPLLQCFTYSCVTVPQIILLSLFPELHIIQCVVFVDIPSWWFVSHGVHIVISASAFEVVYWVRITSPGVLTSLCPCRVGMCLPGSFRFRWDWFSYFISPLGVPLP